MVRKGARPKRRQRRVVSHGRAYIRATFNNTIVSIRIYYISNSIFFTNYVYSSSITHF